MEKIILVAGATGDLGGRIIRALLSRGAKVRAVVRQAADAEKVQKLEAAGIEVIRLDLADASALAKACEGVSCIVSALQGLRDVIVDVQAALLQAAVAAGVPRFIPSDYSTDYTQLKAGDNRNFDLRREFMELIDKEPKIAATTIFNGAFSEILMYNTPFLDFKKKSVGYWGDADWRVDFTTMDDTAAYTAEAALDDTTPRILRIAGMQLSANYMVKLAKEVLHEDYQLVRIGSTYELAAQNKAARAAQPEGENEVYPHWQRSQYMYGMFSAKHPAIDNARYPDLEWSGFEALMKTRK